MSARPVALLLLALLLAVPAAAEDEDRPSPRAGVLRPSRPGSRAKDDVTPELTRAVRRGLAWLAAHQNPDGSWRNGTGELATTGLAVLALMGNGHTETRGKHSRAVRRGVKFLLRHVTTPGSVTPSTPKGFIHVPHDAQSKMHAHGYATLALALAYGMSGKGRRAEMKRKLELAVDLIARSQDPSGGWGYYPTRTSRHEGSVTVCQVQALRMAREAGIRVPPDTIARAITYLKRSQDTKTGGFVYSLSDRARQTYALTSAALSTLFALGEYEERKMIELGLDYLAVNTRHFRDLYRQPWFFYGNFYAAQAMYQAAATTWGERYWREYWPRMRESLIERQDPDGSWEHPSRSRDDYASLAYSTAFACLILEVPLEVLPLFER